MKEITRNSIVDQLNKLLAIDPGLVTRLVTNRNPCTKEYADDPDFVCIEENGQTVAGLVGVLNGLLALGDGRAIAIEWDESQSKIVKFTTVKA